ncbi:MAG: hypothetical protein MJ252_22275 [archaeon]|nr:hypothetical protein [archaeon]
MKWKVSKYEKSPTNQKFTKDSYHNYHSNSRDSYSSPNREQSYKREESVNSKECPSNEGHTIKVREIWVGNLPEGMTEEKLHKIFFIYGEISRIDKMRDKNYAFIKYRLCYSASRAYEKAKNMEIEGKQIKISFSDSGKRKDIKGDEPGFELTEKDCKIIHIYLNKNSEAPEEEKIKNILSKYGTINYIYLKYYTGFRPSIYVEYSKAEEAAKAIQAMNSEEGMENKKELGDTNCEVNYYFQKKIYPQEGMPMNNQMPSYNPIQMMNPNMMMQPGKFPPMMPNMYPMMNPMSKINLFNLLVLYPNYRMMPGFRPGMPMMNPNSPHGQMPNLNPQQPNNPNMPMNPNIPQQNNQMPNPNPMIMPNNQQLPKQIPNQMPNQIPNQMPNQIPNQMPNQMNPQMPNMYPNMPPKPMPFMNFPNRNFFYGNFPQMPSPQIPNPQIPNQFNNFLYKPAQPTQAENNQPNTANNNSEQDNSKSVEKCPSDNITSVQESELSSVNDDMDSCFEKDYSLEEENLKTIWGGVITKGAREKVMVDIYAIRGKVHDVLDKVLALNISHKTSYDEILKRSLIGIVAISPQNVTQKETFEKYLKYFGEKEKAGIINIDLNHSMYVLQPCEFSRKFYQNPKKHMVGLIVDSAAPLKSVEDVNKVLLPPPVISSAEKRILAIKSKKTKASVNKEIQDKEIIETLKKNNISSLSKEELAILMERFPNLKDLLSKNS